MSDLGLDPHQLIPIVGLSIGCATHTLSSFLEFAAKINVRTLYYCRFYGCNVPAVFFHLLRPLRTEKKSDLLVPSWKNMVRRWEFGVLSIVWHSIVCWLEYVRILIFTYIFIYLLHVFNSNCSSPWKIHFNRVYCLPNQYNINITRTHTHIYIYIYMCVWIHFSNRDFRCGKPMRSKPPVWQGPALCHAGAAEHPRDHGGVPDVALKLVLLYPLVI